MESQKAFIKGLVFILTGVLSYKSQVFTKHIILISYTKNGFWGPKHYIFGNQLYSKNARMLRFHVFLHFNARKHDVTILSEVDQIHKELWIYSNLVWVPGEPQFKQNSQYFVN